MSPSSAAAWSAPAWRSRSAASGKRVVLIEAVAPDNASQPSFDDRTTALGNGSRRIFEALGVWPHLAAHAGAVLEIRISDAGHPGAARLSAAEQGLEALGYVVPNRQLGAALWQQLAVQSAITIRNPAQVSEVRLAEGGALLRVDVDGRTETVAARLVVAADGAHSQVRAAAGIGAEVEDYKQVAVVVHVLTDQASDRHCL